MGLNDMLYMVVDNPVTRTVWSTSKQILQPIGTAMGMNNCDPGNGTGTVKIITERLPLWQMAGQSGPFVRIAGLSGALAVGLGAYGAHKKYPKDKMDELKRIYEKGNQFHLIHTLALVGVPLAKYPKISGSMFIVGMTCFSGACYHHAFTGDDRFGKFAPVGGTILILAWLSLVL